MTLRYASARSRITPAATRALFRAIYSSRVTPSSPRTFIARRRTLCFAQPPYTPPRLRQPRRFSAAPGFGLNAGLSARSAPIDDYRHVEFRMPSR